MMKRLVIDETMAPDSSRCRYEDESSLVGKVFCNYCAVPVILVWNLRFIGKRGISLVVMLVIDERSLIWDERIINNPKYFQYSNNSIINISRSKHPI